MEYDLNLVRITHKPGSVTVLFSNEDGEKMSPQTFPCTTTESTKYWNDLANYVARHGVTPVTVSIALDGKLERIFIK